MPANSVSVKDLETSINRLNSNKKATPEERYQHLKDVHTFIGEHIIGKPLENTIPPLSTLIYGIKAATEISLLHNPNIIPALLDLLASVEQCRLILVEKVKTAITYDDFYKKEGADHWLSDQQRKALDRLYDPPTSELQRLTYIELVEDLCSMHVRCILLRDHFDLLEFMARMNEYFPWMANGVNGHSPRLHLHPKAMSAAELNRMHAVGLSIRGIFDKLVKWARLQVNDQKSLQDVLNSSKPDDIVSPIQDPDRLPNLSSAYASQVGWINVQLDRIFPPPKPLTPEDEV